MSEFHSASKLLQDIQIEYTRALDIGILQPIQVGTQQPSQRLTVLQWVLQMKGNVTSHDALIPGTEHPLVGPSSQSLLINICMQAARAMVTALPWFMNPLAVGASVGESDQQLTSVVTC